MELAVITDEISQDLDHALSVMAEYDINNAEIRGAWGVNIADADGETINRIKTTCEKRGARVIGIATPVYKCDLKSTASGDSVPGGRLHGAEVHEYAEQITLLKRCIETAQVLNTKLIRVFTFWRKSELNDQIEKSIVDAFREPAKLAEAAGVTLVIENEHACYFGTGVDTARLLKKINSVAVRAVWDPGNAYFAGENPFPDGYDAIKEFVSHVHVKDANNRQDWCVVGEGSINWPGQLNALKTDGYQGFLSLETHYGGGGDPETSSRQCLVGLKSLFHNL
jgi:sugar phosphate isomerase/epimerase